MLLLKDEAAPSATQSPTRSAQPSGTTNEQPERSITWANYHTTLNRLVNVSRDGETGRQQYHRVERELWQRTAGDGQIGRPDQRAVLVEIRRQEDLRKQLEMEMEDRRRELGEERERRERDGRREPREEHERRHDDDVQGYREALLSTIMYRPLPEAWQDIAWVRQRLEQRPALTLQEFQQISSQAPR